MFLLICWAGAAVPRLPAFNKEVIIYGPKGDSIYCIMDLCNIAYNKRW